MNDKPVTLAWILRKDERRTGFGGGKGTIGRRGEREDRVVGRGSWG